MNKPPPLIYCNRRKVFRDRILSRHNIRDQMYDFTINDLRDCIPPRLWVRSAGKSFAYLARDILAISALGTAFTALNTWYMWPVYWMLQGSMFFALFNIGHDCGHNSFSSNTRLNAFVGLIVHSFLLVPYYGFRKSHRIHHCNHAHPEKDESWRPLSTDNPSSVLVRTCLPLFCLSFPLYLCFPVSHFDPRSRFFSPSDARPVVASSACVLLWLCCLSCFSLSNVLNLFVAPYVVFAAWLSAVSYLHHHGERMPWYRGEAWTFLRGSLSTVDRDYGVFNAIHHDIGTHVVHHMFPQLPHYHLVEATECIRRVLGPHYREPEKCKGGIPTHLLKPLLSSLRRDHYVSPTGPVVFYR